MLSSSKAVNLAIFEETFLFAAYQLHFTCHCWVQSADFRVPVYYNRPIASVTKAIQSVAEGGRSSIEEVFLQSEARLGCCSSLYLGQSGAGDF